jgi:transcriptional regulator with XRE-family HTH domain
MNEDREEVLRVLGVLRTLMRMLGVSNREVERRLNLHPSSLTRFFNGQVEAKLELVLGITRALGLEYNELFSFAYPEGQIGPESAAAQKIRSLLDGLAPPKKRTSSDVPALLRELLAKMQGP